MAKVTIIIEDSQDAEGKPGIIIDAQSSDESEESLANFWGIEAINFIANHGEPRSLTDEEAAVYEKPTTELN